MSDMDKTAANTCATTDSKVPNKLKELERYLNSPPINFMEDELKWWPETGVIKFALLD